MKFSTTEKIRSIIIKLIREHAAADKYIGFADPETLVKAADAVEKDPTQWFALGSQLMSQHFINYHIYEALMDDVEFDPEKA